MKLFFSSEVKYKKRARLGAILWTLLIFFLCFLPGNEIPDVNIPFIDKWAHFILFAAFSFLWLSSLQEPGLKQAFFMLLVSIFVGWLVEYIQGHLTILGRSQDDKDTIADSIGGLLGILAWFLTFRIYTRRLRKHHQH